MVDILVYAMSSFYEAVAILSAVAVFVFATFVLVRE